MAEDGFGTSSPGDETSGDGNVDGLGGDGTYDGGAILPDWLNEISDTLTAFGKNPAGFVLGAVLSAILGGIEAIVAALVDAILVIGLGSDKTLSATGTLGIGDIPVFAVSVASQGVGNLVTGLTSALRTVNRAIVEASTLAGPLSPIVYAAALAVAMIVAAWALRTLIAVVADAIPGVQGLL